MSNSPCGNSRDTGGYEPRTFAESSEELSLFLPKFWLVPVPVCRHSSLPEPIQRDAGAWC